MPANNNMQVFVYVCILTVNVSANTFVSFAHERVTSLSVAFAADAVIWTSLMRLDS